MTFSYIDGEPMLPLKIKSKSGDWIQFHGYLDSGAGYSVFHPDVAEILEIDIYKGEKIFLTVGDGTKIEAFVHKLPVHFAKKEFLGEISFSPSLGIGTNILGLRSFFENFRMCFSHQQQKIEISSLENKNFA